MNITEANNKIELYKLPDEKAGGISFEKVRDEIEIDLDISDITATDLQDDMIGSIIIEEFREQITKKMEDVGYMKIKAGYPSSVFQEIESLLRTEINLIGNDIRLVLDKYNSSFITYEIQPGIYTFEDPSEVLFNILQIEYPKSSSENAIEFDDTSRKTRLIVKSGIKTIRFDENSFF